MILTCFHCDRQVASGGGARKLREVALDLGWTVEPRQLCPAHAPQSPTHQDLPPTGLLPGWALRKGTP